MSFTPELRGAEPPARPIEDIAFEVLETGFQARSCCSMSPSISVIGGWLSDELLEFTALQDVPDANRKQLTRSVLFNVRTREARILLPEGGVQCWNPEQQIAGVKRHVTDEHPRLVRLDTEGNLGELTEPSNLDEFFCWPKDLGERLSGMPGYKSDGLHLRDSDGYIPYNAPGAKISMFYTEPAVWLRPGKSPLILPIMRTEIDAGRAQFLAFRGQYLLNHFDSQGSSSTDRRLAGRQIWGNRPYDLTPYRLLSRDGSIEEIPYPYVIREYGIKGFHELIPTKVGIIIEATDPGKGHTGLFLLNGERLQRFWPRPEQFEFLRTKEQVGGLTLSPDGCKIAFRRYANWQLDTKKTVTIINLCKGA